MQQLIYNNLNEFIDNETKISEPKDYGYIVKEGKVCFDHFLSINKEKISKEEETEMKIELLNNMKRYIIRQVIGINYTDLLKMLYTSKELVNNQEVKEIINKMLDYIK